MYEVSIIGDRRLSYEQLDTITFAQPTRYRNIEDLAMALCANHWSPIVFIDEKILGENFIRVTTLVFDIDKDVTLEEAIRILCDYKHIIITTRHHRKSKNGQRPCDRFRVVLFFENEILDPEVYRENYSFYSEYFFNGRVDIQCNDLARKFYYSEEVVEVKSGLLLKIINKREVKEPKKKQITSIPIKGLLARATFRFIKEGAKEGEWHKSLVKACKDLKQNNYTYDEAITILEQATKVDGNKKYLDQEDIFHIKDIYKRDIKHSARLSKPLKSWNDQDIIDIVIPSLNNSFVVLKKPDGERRYYRRKPDSNEVILLTNPEAIEDFVFDIIRNVTSEDGREEVPTREFIKKVIYIWDRGGWSTITEEPEPFCFLNEDKMTFKKLAFTPVQGLFPAWQEFLCRLSDSGAFMAYVWSCFEKSNKSRQILWLTGSGRDGKSKVFEALQSIFGDAAAAISGAMLNRDFFYSAFYGKRIAFYGDCLNPKFAMHEFVRNFTGEDLVPIEFKKMTPFFIRMYLKIFVASNEPPEITNTEANKSRLLYIKVAESKNKDDPTFVARLNQEIPFFLFECRNYYYQLCPHNANILYNEIVKENIFESTNNFEDENQFLFNKFFKIDEFGVTSSDELWECLNTIKQFNNPYAKSNFKKWLETNMGIKVKRTGNSRVYTGMSLKNMM